MIAMTTSSSISVKALLHGESVSRLAVALGFLGDKEKAAALLRRAQRAYPHDFWTNCDLASSLMAAGKQNDAARFYSAAVALRPRSERALRGLREALQAAGRPE
jgi:Flp pilus assembly protein TadD